MRVIDVAVDRLAAGLSWIVVQIHGLSLHLTTIIELMSCLILHPARVHLALIERVALVHATSVAHSIGRKGVIPGQCLLSAGSWISDTTRDVAVEDRVSTMSIQLSLSLPIVEGILKKIKRVFR